MKTCTTCGYTGDNFPPSAGLKCRPCANARHREWERKNSEKVAAYKETWAKKNPNADRKKMLMRRYGITESEYAQLLDEQDGVCAICRQPETMVRRSHRADSLAVDHCHDTGKVRGLLCTRCNTALGGFNDDPLMLATAIAYLERTAQ